MKAHFDIHTLWLNLYPAPYDHEGALDKLRRYAPGAAVHLWDRERTKPLAEEFEPGLWDELFRLARPVMVVDILRWLVIYRHGGLYWQLGCVPWRPMEAFVPENPEVECRLWTENVMSPEECQKMAAKPIRQGRPEEPIRVANQVIWCRQGAAFAKRMVEFLLERARKWTPQEDYDVLFITANAAVSEAYDLFGKGNPRVELVGLAETRQMVRWKHGGMWRRDPRPVAVMEPRKEKPFDFRLLPPNGVKETAKSLVYRFAKKHEHERMLREEAGWEGEGAVRALEAGCGAFLAEHGIRRIQQIPVGSKADKRFWNLLYDRVPPCDLVAAADWFEWLPYHEIRKIWSQILRSGCRWLAVTTCPLLETQANRGVGDFRPLNLEQAPFLFGEPDATVPFPSPWRRQDRVIGIWNCRKLVEKAEAVAR